MHWIQKHILRQLILSDEQRYADIKPPNVEGSLFMYHLRHVLRGGLAQKLPNGRYCLTEEGKLKVDEFSLESLKPRTQPQVVLLMAVEDGEGSWLFFRRRRHPLINLAGLPYGRVNMGEAIGDAARERLREQTGIIADLEHRGDGYGTTLENGKPISYILFHMFYGRPAGGALIEPSRHGEAFWGRPGDLVKSEMMPNTPDLIKLAQGGTADRRFFAQIRHSL